MRLALSMALCSTVLAAPAAAGWLDAVRAGLRKVDGALEAPPAPDFRRRDLFGKRFSLSDTRGRVVLLSFLDRDSADEAVRWLERQTTWLLHQQDVTFVNVFHPGGIFFMIPRGEAVHRIRKQVRQTHEELAAQLPPEDRSRLEEADIRWVVDWKRRIASHYPVERGRVNLFLLDREGRIRDVRRYDPEKPPEALQASVSALLDPLSAAVELPPAPALPAPPSPSSTPSPTPTTALSPSPTTAPSPAPAPPEAVSSDG